MMKVQAYSNSQYRAANNRAQNNNPSFGAGAPQSLARTAFDRVGDACRIQANGSLTRGMFFIVGTLFMLGGRFFESRDNDEKREVVTRDVPAVALSVAGAPLINQAVAYGVTKKTGVPIVTIAKENIGKPLIAFGKDKVTGEYKYKFGKQGEMLSSAFTEQKQLIDWFSELETADDPLINLANNVKKHGGNIKKVFHKLGFGADLQTITDKADNEGIFNALKDAQSKGVENFKKLEEAVRNIKPDNKVLKLAKNYQTAVKLGGIAFMAALLGYFLPHLNIITTRKKYQKKVDSGNMDRQAFEKKMMRTSPVFRVSSGVLSFHKSSAANTFKNLLSMVESPQSKNQTAKN